MRILFFLSLFIIISIPVLSQRDFRDGYVILVNGDSISGKLAYQKKLNGEEFCKFKSSSSREVLSYHPLEILAFGYYGDRRFETKNLSIDSVSGKLEFTEVLIKGYMSLLRRNNTLYIELKGGKIITLPRPTTTVVQTEKGISQRENLAYIGILNSLLLDCAIKVDRPPYRDEEIGELIKSYNVCHHEHIITYKDSKKATVVSFDVFGGMQASKLFQSSDKKKLSDSDNVFAGIGLNVSVPKVSDRTSFSMEVLYSKQIFESHSGLRRFILYQNLIKVPIGIKYSFLNENHTPYIKAGVASGLKLKWKYEEGTKVKDITGWHLGYYGAIGYTQALGKKLKGFLELRYEKMAPSGSNGMSNYYDIINYYNTSLYILGGVRF